MHIKSIVAAATITLIAGVGSVSADELSVAGTAGDPGTPFAMLDGIATEQMSVQELAATRGAAVGQLDGSDVGYGFIQLDGSDVGYGFKQLDGSDVGLDPHLSLK